MNLNEVLNEFQKYEEMAIEIPEDVKEFLKDKIDAYQMVASRLASDIMRYKEHAEHFKKKMEARANELERLKNFILNSMEYHGWDELKGNTHKVKVIRQKRFSIIAKPSADAYQALPDLIDRKILMEYEWKKDQLKEVFKTDPEKVKDFADMKEIKYIRFD